MISSGLKVPRPAIPMPDFEVPRAAPTATIISGQVQQYSCVSMPLNNALLKIIYRKNIVNQESK